MTTAEKFRPWLGGVATLALVIPLLGTVSAPAQAAEGNDDDEACSIHLFDGDDFDESDDNFILTEPGEYADLAELPGADQDWTDEADSAKVGSGATVEIFAETDFEGNSRVLDPGSEHGSVDPQPSSLKMTCEDAGFTDVDENNAFLDDIAWLADEGITTGYDDGTYRPKNAITREAMAAYFYRMAGEPDVTSNTERFSDVDEDNSFLDAITWLADEDITTGYDDGTYRPKNAITREAMAAFVNRYADQDPDGDTSQFSDIGDSAFADEIAWLADEEITTGYDDGTYRPKNAITREATAAYLHRYDMTE